MQANNNPEYCTEIDKFQTALIPAGMEDFEVVNMHEGPCTLVIWRFKVD